MSSSDSSVNSEEDDEHIFERDLPRGRANDPRVTELSAQGWYDIMQDMTAEDWEQLGREINNNTHLTKITFEDCIFGRPIQYQRMSSFFRGLTGSSTINTVSLTDNDFRVQGVHDIAPFLQSTSSLTNLDISQNNIGSEGFNLLWRALCDSRIKDLTCNGCGIHSIEIDANHLPKLLTNLYLANNNISADGSGELAKLLQAENSRLYQLDLDRNKIDDESVRILADALQNNTSLAFLDLNNNDRITIESKKTLLKLVLDISSIKATLGSNHTLMHIKLNYADNYERSTLIEKEISSALRVNVANGLIPETTGRQKIIDSQLCCAARSQLCRLQGVEQSNASFYSQFDPLLLPEVLALTGKYHEQEDLYIALRWSFDALFSTVNKEVYLKEQIDYHTGAIYFHQSKRDKLQAELGSIQGAGSEYRSAKRPRIE